MATEIYERNGDIADPMYHNTGDVVSSRLALFQAFQDLEFNHVIGPDHILRLIYRDPC